jgi:tripartite-type tricarboxylate transporter receptor subunit TctC
MIHMRASHRQSFASVALVGISLAAAPGIAQPQSTFPNKPIRIVASTTAGGQPDGIARVIGQKMSENWGRPVVIDNRPGGGGLLAASMVAKAAPDGHTLLYALPNFTISAVMQPSLPFDPIKDFARIGQIGFSTNVLVATPAIGVKSVKELIALAKAQPGKLVFSSSATGSAAHLTGARFNLIAGIKVVHVAFKGGPDAAIEVLAGRAQFHVGTMAVVLPFVNEGKMVALAVTSPTRAAVLPNVPALAETLSEFQRPETSHGLLAPAATPRAILSQINKELLRILDLPDVKERLQTINYVTAPSTPEEYDKILRGQIETLAKLVGDTGLRGK